MSIDKTLRLTDETGSQIRSLLDSKFRATINVYPQDHTGHPKLTNSHSLKNLRDDSNRYLELQYQNEILKAEIVTLKKQIRGQKQGKLQQVRELEQQIEKLKKLIQKSYFSLKALEKQNISFQGEINGCRQKQRRSTQRINFLEIKLNEAYQYIKNAKINHQKQVRLIWQRVSHLQKNLQTVVQIIDEDRKQQKYYRNHLQKSRLGGSSISAKSFRFN